MAEPWPGASRCLELLGAAILLLVPAAASGDAFPAPSPREPLPREPARIARTLTTTSNALDAAIEQWLAKGNPSRASPPQRVTLEALYQQRLELQLTRRPRLARLVVARLTPAIARWLRSALVARRELDRITRASPLRVIRTGPALPAGRLLRDYQQAERRFHVGWHVLAAVNFVESAFGRLRNASPAGARGPMQFLPATWRRYGLGGDIRDPHDAILGAANYLHSAGAPRDYRRALLAYNPSSLYVDAVLRYTREMRRDRRSYFAYYSRQVFVHTPSGVRRLTGPGIGVTRRRP